MCLSEIEKESDNKTEFGRWRWTESGNTQSNLCPRHPHRLSLSSSKSMVVNWSVQSPSVFFLLLLCGFTDGFRGYMSSLCRGEVVLMLENHRFQTDHQSWLSCVWLTPTAQTQIFISEFYRCLSTTKGNSYSNFQMLPWTLLSQHDNLTSVTNVMNCAIKNKKVDIFI